MLVGSLLDRISPTRRRIAAQHREHETRMARFDLARELHPDVPEDKIWARIKYEGRDVKEIAARMVDYELRNDRDELMLLCAAEEFAQRDGARFDGYVREYGDTLMAVVAYEAKLPLPSEL